MDSVLGVRIPVPAAPVRPPSGGQVVDQFRRELEGRRRKDVVGKHLQRGPLLGRRDHAHRRSGVGIALVIAGHVVPAHVLGRHGSGGHVLVHQHAERATHPLIPVAFLDEVVDEFVEDLLDQFDALLAVREWVTAQVEAIHERVRVIDVMIRRVRETGLGDPAGDLLEIL